MRSVARGWAATWQTRDKDDFARPRKRCERFGRDSEGGPRSGRSGRRLRGCGSVDRVRRVAAFGGVADWGPVRRTRHPRRDQHGADVGVNTNNKNGERIVKLTMAKKEEGTPPAPVAAVRFLATLVGEFIRWWRQDFYVYSDGAYTMVDDGYIEWLVRQFVVDEWGEATPTTSISKRPSPSSGRHAMSIRGWNCRSGSMAARWAIVSC